MIVANILGLFITAPANTGIICCIAPIITIDKTPNVNRCTTEIAILEYLFIINELSLLNITIEINMANNGAVIKNLKGTSIGGACSKDKP
jgi:hypothetical protein